MTNKKTFDILVIIARPAAGKSEIIDYLKKYEIQQRIEKFHIGSFNEIDDFPMLWRWFEEDALLSEMGFNRLHSDADGYFIDDHLWNLLIRLMVLDYKKLIRNIPNYHDNKTVLFEFSRGEQHGGYKSAFQQFEEVLLTKMALLYVDVSWEESLRKNRMRFNPARPDSILEHGLPDTKLEKLYRETDWQTLSIADPEYLSIKSVKIPYVTFDNSDDVTTARGPALGVRLEQTMAKLWDLYTRK